MWGCEHTVNETLDEQITQKQSTCRKFQHRIHQCIATPILRLIEVTLRDSLWPKNKLHHTSKESIESYLSDCAAPTAKASRSP